MVSLKTACRICALCGFEAEVEDNQIISFKSDREHPISGGYSCVKGKAGFELQQGHSNRLSTSLKRGESGELQPIDYKEACGEIGHKLLAIVEEHGPRSVAVFVGTGAVTNTLGFQFPRAFMRAIGSPNYFSTLTLDQSCHAVTVGRMGVYLGGEHVPADVDVALVAGMNPLMGHLGYPTVSIEAMNPGKKLREAKKRGQKLIVIDPRLTETASMADLHLQIIPGEDATLFAGLVHLLFANDSLDHEFHERYAENTEKLNEAVRGYTPDYVANRCGIPEKQLHQAAKMFGEAKRPHAGCSTGTSMAPYSNLADFLMESMNVLKGGYRRAGDPVKNGAPLLSLMPAVADVMPPNRTWEQGPKCRTQDIGQLNNEFPSSLLPAEILKDDEDKIRALIVVGGNPLKSMPAPHHTTEAFKDLDLLVTLDHRLSETAEISDYALATATQYERHDMCGILELFFDKNFVQYFPPAIKKAESIADDWEVLWEISRVMGKQLEFKYCLPGIDHSILPPGLMLDMENKPSEEMLFRTVCESRGISFDELKASPNGLVLPESAPVAAPAGDSGARLDLCPDDVVEELIEVKQQVAIRHPYRLSVRRILGAMNSHYHDSEFSQRKFPVNFAYMNPEDMAREGITDGSKIRIRTDSNEIIGTAKEDKTLRTGVVSMAHCFGKLNPADDPEGNFGAFTGHLIPPDNDHREPINFMPHMTGIPIDVIALD